MKGVRDGFDLLRYGNSVARRSPAIPASARRDTVSADGLSDSPSRHAMRRTAACGRREVELWVTGSCG
jgi:hypothetical protein